MKLVLLAARNDIHTVRWVNSLAERGHDVHLLTMHSGGDPVDERVRTYQLKFPAPFGYFLNAWQVRRLLKQIRPALLHAHYASGYGTLGRLSGYHPYVLSVWGKDVYEFPYRSWLHAKIMADNLHAPDHVCSTSRVMAEQTRALSSELRRLSVTPFGIDPGTFAPDPSVCENDVLTIGTVKKLRPKYAVDVLIRAFAKTRVALRRTHPETADRLRLLIVGGGPERDALKTLCSEVQVDDVTTFTGPVSHAQVPAYLNRLDIYAALSRADSESFGVAILEASACECPVVVSEAGGLPEVVDAGNTGFVVAREDPEAAADALRQLVLDGDLRARMGAAGRQRVLDQYQWTDSVTTMERVYEHVT